MFDSNYQVWSFKFERFLRRFYKKKKKKRKEKDKQREIQKSSPIMTKL